MKRPLFLLSPSCLRNDFISKMFAQHHEMISLSDNRLLTRELMSEWIEDFCWSQLSKVILPSFATLLFEEQTMRTIKMARNWLISRSKMNTVKVFSELCQKVSPRIWSIQLRCCHINYITWSVSNRHFLLRVFYTLRLIQLLTDRWFWLYISSMWGLDLAVRSLSCQNPELYFF